MEFKLNGTSTFEASKFSGFNILSSKKEIIKFAPNYSAKTWVSLVKDDDDGTVFILFWIESKFDIFAEITLINKYYDKTLDLKGLFGKKTFLKVYWGMFSKLFEFGRTKVEWSAILKPKIVIPAEVSRPAIQGSLLDDDELSDFKIICENQTFKVHKCVLAVASPVFRAMFQNECQEKEKNEVVIKDFEVATVQAGINLIYKRELDMELELDIMLELLKFADKYDLNDKDLIEKWFESNLSLENVCKIVVFATENFIDWLLDDCVSLLAKDLRKMAGLNNFDLLNLEILTTVLVYANKNLSL